MFKSPPGPIDAHNHVTLGVMSIYAEPPVKLREIHRCSMSIYEDENEHLWSIGAHPIEGHRCSSSIYVEPPENKGKIHRWSFGSEWSPYVSGPLSPAESKWGQFVSECSGKPPLGSNKGRRPPIASDAPRGTA
jgi:hypothetical protein